jgi:hypothetical protein
MPINAGSPRCTGAPCTAGKREVICTARMAAAARSGRIVTTSGPLNGPAGAVARLVRNMATLRPSSMWRRRRPSSSSACSKLKEQPSTKATMSSVQSSLMSVGWATSLPSRQTR